VRNSLRLTLRDVAAATEPRIGESYLSQIENGRIAVPSPKALHALAAVYEVDPGDLLRRAYELPPEEGSDKREARLPEWAGWLPAATLKSLDEDERNDVLAYLRLVEERRERKK